METFCTKCHGVGEVPSGYGRFGSGMMAWRVCPLCEGTGLDEEAARAELADEARFSNEVINADLESWEAHRQAELAAMPVPAGLGGVPF